MSGRPRRTKGCSKQGQGRISKSKSARLKPHQHAQACVCYSRISPSTWNPAFRSAHSLPWLRQGSLAYSYLLFTAEEPPKPCVTPLCYGCLKVTHRLRSVGQDAAAFSRPWDSCHCVHLVHCGSFMGVHKMLGSQETRWIWRTWAGWVSARPVATEAGRNLWLCCSMCFMGWFLLGLEDWGEGWGVALLSSHRNLVSFPNISS